MTNLIFWKDDDIQRVDAALKNGRASRSLFYTLPIVQFSDTTDDNFEHENNTVKTADSPSFDLFDDQMSIHKNWEDVNAMEVLSTSDATKPLKPENFLDALANDQFEKSWSFDEMLAAAEKAVVNSEFFTAVLIDFLDKQSTHPLEIRKKAALALIIARLSQPGELPFDIFSTIVNGCSSNENTDDKQSLNIWSDVFKTLVSEGRLNINATNRFLDLIEKRLRTKQNDLGALLSVICESVNGWTEQIASLLSALFKLLTFEEKNNSRPFLNKVSEFDLAKLVGALYEVMLMPNLRSIAASRDFFSLLETLVRHFPSFLQKSAEFVKIVNELLTMSANSECPNVTQLRYRRLHTIASSYSASRQ